MRTRLCFQGWISVRKESRIQFAICMTIAVILLGISSALFASPSTLISLFFMPVATGWVTWSSVSLYFPHMAIFHDGDLHRLCLPRCHHCILYHMPSQFREGFSSLLWVNVAFFFLLSDSPLVHVTQVLAGIDFTPVCFSKTEESPVEKNLYSNLDNEMASVHFPPPTYPSLSAKVSRASWIFSAQNRFTVQISTTPSWLSEVRPVPPSLVDKVVCGPKEKQKFRRK